MTCSIRGLSTLVSPGNFDSQKYIFSKQTYIVHFKVFRFSRKQSKKTTDFNLAKGYWKLKTFEENKREFVFPSSYKVTIQYNLYFNKLKSKVIHDTNRHGV